MNDFCHPVCPHCNSTMLVYSVHRTANVCLSVCLERYLCSAAPPKVSSKLLGFSVPFIPYPHRGSKEKGGFMLYRFVILGCINKTHPSQGLSAYSKRSRNQGMFNFGYSCSVT